MSIDTQLPGLVQFFKVLGEPNRLKIVGLLAKQPSTVEQLAGQLKLSASTTSHHLSRLSDAGLVEARSESYYSIYSLKTDVLTTMARALLKETEAKAETGLEDLDSYDRKVLATFLTPEGASRRFRCRRRSFSSFCATC